MTAIAIPRPGPPPRLRPPEATRRQDANGLTVRTVSRRRLPIVDALLIMPTGAASDPPALAGLASLTADLLDSGTAYRSQADIARALDAIGARVSATAQWDFAAVSLQVLSGQLPDALGIVAEMVRSASFPEHEIDRGRTDRLAELEQSLEDPESLAGQAIARAIHGADHIYGLARAGTVTTVGRIDRSTIVRCHQARYRAAGATLVLVGDVADGAAERMVADAFGDWPSTDEAASARLPVVSSQPTAIHLVDRPDSPQSEIRIGTVGASRSSRDYFPLVVLNTILGGSFTSRLNTRLRERGGYTYGAFSAFSFRRDPGPFVAGAAVFADATARAVAETLEEIERIGTEPVPGEELDRARRYLTLGMARGFEANGSVAARIADIELHGLGDDWWLRHAERIEGVDAATVLEVAQRYLDPARLAVVAVGDAARIRGSLEALDIGPVIDTKVE